MSDKRFKTNYFRVNVPQSNEHLNKYEVKEHCYYCDKALYTMGYNSTTQEVSWQPDNSHWYNSEYRRVCKPCSDRLIRRGSKIECSSCENLIYEFKFDKFKEDDLKYSDIKGVHPQQDPIEEVVNRCVHCRTEILWG